MLLDCMERKRVLIETLWNVKVIWIVVVHKIHYSINRNIVECKEDSNTFIFLRLQGINRNIVECKVTSPPNRFWTLVCINRNIVECKDKFPPGIQAGNAY